MAGATRRATPPRRRITAGDQAGAGSPSGSEPDPAGAGSEPGCFFGIRPVKKSEITPMTARIESAVRRPAICESSYVARMSSWTSVGTPAFCQLRLGFAVGDEGCAGGEVGVGLRLHRLRHVGVGLDAGQERSREGSNEDRAGERRADRGAELAGGVLQTADLRALLGRHRRDRHVAELGRQGADAEADDEHRHEDDRGVGAHLEAGDQHQDAGDEREHADAHDTARIGLREEPGDADRRDQQRQRERQQPHARGHRRQPQYDRQEQRHDEEQPRLDQELEQKRDEAAGELPDAQQRRRDERLLAAVLQAGLPAEEQPQQEEPAHDEPDGEREAEQGRRALFGQQPAPRRRLEDAEDDQGEAGGRDRRRR